MVHSAIDDMIYVCKTEEQRFSPLYKLSGQLEVPLQATVQKMFRNVHYKSTNNQPQDDVVAFRACLQAQSSSSSLRCDVKPKSGTMPETIHCLWTAQPPYQPCHQLLYVLIYVL